ncbi:MAG: winged helix DNA-binding domain-containing protein [Oscillospiraceae bacterium]|nr:winged helix DNA-binding domain-containing protein [Oscillospiraceae bacterium]
MTEASLTEAITRRRYHGLYLSRQCPDIVDLSRELLGLHCWFHRNVAFSALIRGADLSGWKSALTKTWLYRGTLHGAAYDELPRLLSLHRDGESWLRRSYSEQMLSDVADKVVRCMEDGVHSRAEMRKIFAYDYEPKVIEAMFSPWGGIFVYLAGLGKVAFRDMASRDFDLIDAEPAGTRTEVLPEMLRRYFKAYGPATLDDAAWFFGFWREDRKMLRAFPLDEYDRFELDGRVYYRCGEPDGMDDLPEFNLLSGFDPIIVSYTERSAVLPAEYKRSVILKSGICLPTVAVNGKVAGLWNIKKGEPVVEFFKKQPKRIESGVLDLVDSIHWHITGRL